MNSGPITEDDLNGYVDQTLDAARHADVAAYLDSYPDAARRIAGYREQRDRLRAAFGPIAEEPLPSELDLSRMIGERRRPAAMPRWAIAAAAVVMLGIGTAGGWSLRGMSQTSPAGLQALGREAAASYAVYAPDLTRPVELRANDRTQLVAWTSQRLGRPVAIPDLVASGYRFMGGRIVATEHGPAVLFMYDDDRGSRLVMFARTMTVDANAPMVPHARDGVNGFSWSDDGLGYSLVGTPASEALHPIADEARRQLRGAA